MTDRPSQPEVFLLISHAMKADPGPEGWDEDLKTILRLDPEEDNGERLWMIAGKVDDHRRRLTNLADAIKRARLEDVRRHGPIRLGDSFVKIVPDGVNRVLDRDALIGWLDQAAEELGTPSLIPAAYRLDDRALRVTTLREIAERLYRHREPDDPSDEAAEDYARMVQDTFLARKEGETLAELPESRMPKYATGMRHGDRVGSFKNKEQPTG
jgi:hypothetical protein